MTLKFPEVCDAILDEVVQIALGAGRKICDVYEQDFDVEEKGNGSPVTQADIAANEYIVSGLKRLDEQYPIVSEEADETVPYDLRSQWPCFWLVDPLDGTKEFVSRNGEFTVNIALIENGEPVLGVVHVPVSGVTYVGCKLAGAHKIDGSGAITEIRAGNYQGGNVRVVGSRSHASKLLQVFADRFSEQEGSVELISMGSSLKLCLVAEGEADVYPRFGPTSEWDTAAAHAVVNAAGGRVTDMQGNDLQYNKRDILNPFFIVRDAGQFDWTPYVKEDGAELSTQA